MRKLLISTLLFLTACGPVYHTDYTLTPPASPSGKQCANQCYYVREGCVGACDNVRYNCGGSGLYGGVGYSTGHRGYGFGGIGVGSPHHHAADCRYETELCAQRCEVQYRHCFSNCGGQVTPLTSCVQNCPQPTPP
jgi:hypothetical protein